jgi:ABC-2 type transport system permease protein
MKLRRSLQRLGALIFKETVQILRDRRTLMLMFALPIIQLFLFAYAVSLTVRHLPTAIVDQSLDNRSREFTEALVNSSYFDNKMTMQNEAEVVSAIDSGQVKAGIIIPPNFSESIARGNGNVLIILDGSDSFSVQSGYNAASTIAQKYMLDLTTQTLQKKGSSTASTVSSGALPVQTMTRVLYNPDIRDMVYLLPGLIALIMQNIIVAHSAMAMVRERESGVFEQLLATPARPIEIVIAKLIPGMAVTVLDMAFILVLGVFWFGVPVQGSMTLLALLSLLFILSGMGLGLLISTITKTQRMAQQVTAFVNVLTMLLSGFIYTRATMPTAIQWIGNLLPLTYFMRMIRGVITKGVGMNFLWTDTLYLAIYAGITLFLTALTSKKRLD